MNTRGAPIAWGRPAWIYTTLRGIAGLVHLSCVTPLLLAALAGCVSVDSRIRKEAVEREATIAMSGKFANKSTYSSRGSNNLSTLLGVRYPTVETAVVTFNEGSDLTLEFLVGETPVASKTYRAQDGLSITSDGKIELFTKVHCELKLLWGCFRETVTLFVNKQGDLLLTQSMVGGGLFIIVIPLFSYESYLAVFPRQT